MNTLFIIFMIVQVLLNIWFLAHHWMQMDLWKLQSEANVHLASSLKMIAEERSGGHPKQYRA